MYFVGTFYMEYLRQQDSMCTKCGRGWLWVILNLVTNILSCSELNFLHHLTDFSYPLHFLCCLFLVQSQLIIFSISWLLFSSICLDVNASLALEAFFFYVKETAWKNSKPFLLELFCPLMSFYASAGSRRCT